MTGQRIAKKLRAGIGLLHGGSFVVALSAKDIITTSENPTIVVGTFDSRAESWCVLHDVAEWMFGPRRTPVLPARQRLAHGCPESSEHSERRREWPTRKPAPLSAPVLYLQRLDLLELALVVRDEDQAERQCVSGDHHVVWTKRPTAALQ